MLYAFYVKLNFTSQKILKVTIFCIDERFESLPLTSCVV